MAAKPPIERSEANKLAAKPPAERSEANKVYIYLFQKLTDIRYKRSL